MMTMTMIIIVIASSQVRGKDRLEQLEQKHREQAGRQNVSNLLYSEVVSRAKASKQAISTYFEAMKRWTVPLDIVTELGKQKMLEQNIKDSYVHIDRYLRHVHTVGTSVTSTNARVLINTFPGKRTPSMRCEGFLPLCAVFL